MAFPPICLSQRSLRVEMVTNAFRTQSPYSFVQTPYDFMGGMWAAQLDLNSLKARDRATFMRWIASLDGPFSTFELYALDYSGPFGTMSANPTIAAVAPARSKTIRVDVPSGSAFVPDDQITIAGHLHIITSVSPESGGEQDIVIWPRLRADVAISDPVEALAPFGSWALAESANGYSLANRIAMSSTLDLIEAL